MTVLEDDSISISYPASAPNRNQLSLNPGNQLKRKHLENISYYNPTKKSHLEAPTKMLNGYKNDSARLLNDYSIERPIATLSNTGNTCYLNSVLYSLRFTPTFLHNLHHLVDDLYKLNCHASISQAKSSSLGRGVESHLSGSSSRSTSSKDLLSIGITNDFVKTKVQIVTEKLHELFVNLHQLEDTRKKDTETYQPVAFIQAVKEANYIFEGNQQQDAHELLVYLLDNIRETCNLTQRHCYANEVSNPEPPKTQSKNNKFLGMSCSFKRKEKTSKNDITNYPNNYSDIDRRYTDVSSNAFNKSCYNFVVEDFQGITLRRTKCLECESTTEIKEPFYDIPVPIMSMEDINSTNELYKRACVTTEKLSDTNKYLCENCARYNEATREVSFEKLPNVMVLQLKRFMTSSGGFQKINTYMPTPLKLACFCQTCCALESSAQLHHYELSCIIMHLGGSMASGHYIAYVRTLDQMQELTNCSRDICKSSNTVSLSDKTSIIFKIFKSKDVKNGLSTKHQVNDLRTCQTNNCCGIKANRNILENSINFSKYTNQDSRSNFTYEMPEDMWLECDDENVKPISSSELQDLLGYKTSPTSTPYLLFYTKY